MNHWLRWFTLTALCLFSVLYWWRGENVADERQDNIDPNTPTLRLYNLQAQQFDATGKPTSSLSSPQVDYYDDARGSLYQQPQLQYFDHLQRFNINSDSAQVSADKNKIHFNGNVLAQTLIDNQPQRWLTAPTLDYDRQRQIVYSDDNITLHSANSHTHALGASWQIDQDIVSFKQQVRSTYEITTQP